MAARRCPSRTDMSSCTNGSIHGRSRQLLILSGSVSTSPHRAIRTCDGCKSERSSSLSAASKTPLGIWGVGQEKSSRFPCRAQATLQAHDLFEQREVGDVFWAANKLFAFVNSLQ